MYSQEPLSRTSRMIGNVSIEETGKGFATVRSKFMMIEYRREQQRLFGGTALHRLVQADGRIMIAWKRVDLVNCDAPLDGITTVSYTHLRPQPYDLGAKVDRPVIGVAGGVVKPDEDRHAVTRYARICPRIMQ